MLQELEVPFNSDRKLQITVHKLEEAGSFMGIAFPAGSACFSL